MTRKLGWLLGALLVIACSGLLWLVSHRRSLPVPGMAKEQVIYVYGWSDYLPEKLQAQFTAETGIRIVYQSYDSNEAMYSRLRFGSNLRCDLIMPSGYFLAKLREEKMVLPINFLALAGSNHIAPQFLHQAFDPENQFSIPYLWSATGIGAVQNTSVKAWSDLWSPQFENSVALLDDAREVIWMAERALPKQGVEATAATVGRLQEASKKLQALGKNVVLFNADSPHYPYISEEAAVGMIWSGSAWLAQQAGYPIQFIWPEDGALFWVDVLAIPAQAKHPELAKQLIEFLLRPEIAAELTKLTGFPCCNETAIGYLPINMQIDPLLNPPKRVFVNAIWIDSAPAWQALYEELFEGFKLRWN